VYQNGFKVMGQISRKDSAAAVSLLSGSCSSFQVWTWLRASSCGLAFWPEGAFPIPSLHWVGWARRKENKRDFCDDYVCNKDFFKIIISINALTGSVWV